MPTLPHTLLGPLVLSPHLLLRGIYTASTITWEDKRTIGGLLKSRPARTIRGRKLTLDGTGNHLTGEQIVAILGLINTGQPVQLVHHLLTATVRVDAIADAGGELLDLADYRPDLWADAQIELTEL